MAQGHAPADAIGCAPEEKTIREVRIAGQPLGPGHPPFVIAEMSGNHGGDLGRALEIVEAVAEAGADAVKLQTYSADTMTLDLDAPAFRVPKGHPLWGGRRLHELYAQASTPWEWHEALFARAADLGLLAFSSPFDATAVAFLEGLDCPVYKIASSEIIDIPLIREVAQTGKPTIISTGMASVAEVGAAVSEAEQGGSASIVLMVCTADYPADPSDSHLRRIPAMADAFNVVVGLSDHTLGTATAVGSVALGASAIEKHVTLDRLEGGIDSAFSLEPVELERLVGDVATVWKALGTPEIGPRGDEAVGRRFRRSLYVAEPVTRGDLITTKNVRSVRPAGGMSPAMLDVVLGRRFAVDAVSGTPLTWDVVGPA